jgi:hypothetical protein
MILWCSGARADASYPFQGTTAFRSGGVVTQVDGDRDRATITASDGTHYSLDTDSADIHLRDTSRPGNTGDLVQGMHVNVVGRLLAPGIVAVDSLTVLPYSDSGAHSGYKISEHPESESHGGYKISEREQAAASPPPASAGSHIRLRGTVESVDDANGIIVVHVNDHSRTIHVDDRTDLSGIPSPDDAHIGVQPGDRVTVSGTLLADGDVTAQVVNLNDSAQSADTGDSNNAHELVGTVVLESNKYMTRDITVMIDPDHEVTVHVPHDARVSRDGQPISIHEVKGNDTVRVRGSYSGDNFTATRIEVLPPSSDM